MAALVIRAIDQETAHAHVAHVGEGDLRLAGALGHARMIPPEVKPPPVGAVSAERAQYSSAGASFPPLELRLQQYAADCHQQNGDRQYRHNWQPDGVHQVKYDFGNVFNKFAHRNCFGGKRPIIALIEALLWIPDNYGAAPRGAAANKKPPAVTTGGRVLGSSCSGPSIVSPRTPPKGST